MSESILKVPKALVLFNDVPPPPTPFYVYECRYCMFFKPNIDAPDKSACTQVESDIKPTSWCLLWLAKNPFALRFLPPMPV